MKSIDERLALSAMKNETISTLSGSVVSVIAALSPIAFAVWGDSSNWIEMTALLLGSGGGAYSGARIARQHPLRDFLERTKPSPPSRRRGQQYDYGDDFAPEPTLEEQEEWAENHYRY